MSEFEFEFDWDGEEDEEVYFDFEIGGDITMVYPGEEDLFTVFAERDDSVIETMGVEGTDAVIEYAKVRDPDGFIPRIVVGGDVVAISADVYHLRYSDQLLSEIADWIRGGGLAEVEVLGG